MLASLSDEELASELGAKPLQVLGPFRLFGLQ